MAPDLNTVIQGGSFALLAVALVWGAPAVLREVKEMRGAYTASLDRLQDRFLAALDRRDARDEAKSEKANAILSDLADRVTDLADRTDEHRQLLDHCPHRHPLPAAAPPPPAKG